MGSIPGLLPLLVSTFANMAVLMASWILLQRSLGHSLLLPLLALAPPVVFHFPLGYLCDRFAKAKVLRYSALLSLVPVALTLPLLHAQMRGAAMGMLVFLSLLGSLHSVARYALLKELAGVRLLAPAMAALQVSTLLSALGAVLLGWNLYDWLSLAPLGASGMDYSAGSLSLLAGLLLLCLVSWLAACRLPTGESGGEAYARMRASYYLGGQYLLRNLRNIWTNPVLRQATIGVSLFWVLVLALALLFYGRSIGSDWWQYKVALALAGLLLGCLYAGRMSADFIETGLLPLGALGVSLSLFVLGCVPWAATALPLYGLLGFSGGVFVVPLYALLLYNTRSHNAGGVVATLFLVRGVFLLLFLLAGHGWLQVRFAAGKGDYWLLSLLTFAAALYILKVLPQSLIRQLLRGVLGNVYRLRVRGISQVPWEGPVLLVGNHVSLLDWALLQMACPRPLHIVMSRDHFEKWYVRLLLNRLNLILMDPRHPELALSEAHAALGQGHAVAVFPEVALSRTGNLNAFRLDLGTMALDNGAVVIPFYIQGLWGSYYSHANALYRANSGGLGSHSVVVAFGAPLSPDTDAVMVHRKVQELSIDAWSAYIRTLRPIAHSFLRTAQKVGSAPCVFSPDGNHYSGTRLLTAVLSFAQVMERTVSRESRVGILLPPSGAALTINLAALAKGKTVVNLNYSAGTATMVDCIGRAGLSTVYTARVFAEKLKQRGVDVAELARHCQIVYAEDIAASIPKGRLLYNFFRARVLPAWWLEFSDFRRVKLDDVAAIMFSSGSEGVPKGVELTHYNFMGNVKQVVSVLNPTREDVILGSLPLFHAFGLAVTTFMPVLEGIPVVPQPDPTDAKAVGRVCAEFRVTIMVGTSTFLRMYATSKHVHPLMFRHVRLIFAGAEKLREEVRSLYRTRFQIEIFEGYGTTETTPVASVNTYDTLLDDYVSVQTGNKVGTVGTPLPGSQFRVVDPSSMQELPVGEDGLILIGGAQIMKGYLDDPERTAQAVVTLDGKRWYKTGDKGHVDSEGFLTIVDRYSRFAKLGGEMVSLGAVEQRISESGAMDGHDFCVVAIPDAAKGEKVVLMYAGELDADAIKVRLRAVGLPPLMQPGLVYAVEAVPKLGTGKADFGAARKLALSLAGS